MSVENYIKYLPNDIAVTLSVEKCFSKDEKDRSFMIECRIADGEFTGDLIRLWFYRDKKAGGPNKITTKLLECCNPGKAADDCPSYSMQGKIFQTTPWQPQVSNYPMYGTFKFIGFNDYAENTSFAPPADSAPLIETQKPLKNLDEIPF